MMEPQSSRFWLEFFSFMYSSCWGETGGQANMAMALPFTDVVLTIVKPFQKTAHVETIDPISTDLASADVYVPLFFAYRLADNSEAVYSQLLKRLKDSLQKVLVPFFSFAGRWIASPRGAIGDRELLCNDEGVPFIEAHLDKDLDSLVHASAAFQPVPGLQGYDVLRMDVTQIRQEMRPDGLPCIFVQVTHFKCGGVVLAVTFNHMHTDGKGFFNFMTVWSDLARSNETAIKVEHNRALAEKESLKTFISRQKKTSSAPSSAAKGAEDDPTKGWAMKALEVSASTIRNLKQEADYNSKDGPGFASTGDYIIAHFWKALSRLPSSMLGGHGKELAITMAVEGRSRFYDPPLPNLCGNAVAAMVAPRIPNNELRELPVTSIACKLREKLLRTTLDEWLGVERLEEYSVASRSPQFASVRVTSWFAFPIYDMDFGFGRPFFATGVNSRIRFRGIGVILIGPAMPSSSAAIASVSIMSTLDIIEALQHDQEFLPLFLPPGNLL